MKSLNAFLEGLLNKSNKSSVLNAGEEIVTIIREKAAQEKRINGSVDWDPVKKVLSLENDYGCLLDGEIIDLIRSIPGVTLYTDFFHLYTPDGIFPDNLVIDFDIKEEIGDSLISYCKSTSIQNCTFEITSKFSHDFDIRKGNLFFTNVKFIGNMDYGLTLYPKISIIMHGPDAVPIFKNVELLNMPLEIECPAWRKYSDKVKQNINKDTDPGDVIKMFGLDGITKENFKDIRHPYIEIKCPPKPGDRVKESMKISRVKPEDKKYIEQNGWFIYFS